MLRLVLVGMLREAERSNPFRTGAALRSSFHADAADRFDSKAVEDAEDVVSWPTQDDAVWA